MPLYTERHGMRKNITPTEIVTVDMYVLLFDKCKQYFDNISWKYPDDCSDGYGCSGLDERKLINELKFKIPSLFGVQDTGKYEWNPYPSVDVFDGEDLFDPYSLFDFIEFMYDNIRDISRKDWHDFMRHNHIKFTDGRVAASQFLKEINEVFTLTGLQFILSEEGKIERVLSDNLIIEDTKQEVSSLKDQGLIELVTDAINLYKTPRKISRSQAVEKIWDAFERLKTYYSPKLDKRDSANKVISNAAGNSNDFQFLLTTEFKTLTDIGNSYRIRHHEVGKKDLSDDKHFDYLFSRCLALINLAIHYLK